MAGRGKGLRLRKLEAPKPRKPSLNSASVLDCLTELQNLEAAVVGRTVTQAAVESLIQSLKICGQQLEDLHRSPVDHAFNAVRYAVEQHFFPPIVSMSLLELIELRASEWVLSDDAESYYREKSSTLANQVRRSQSFKDDLIMNNNSMSTPNRAFHRQKSSPDPKVSISPSAPIVKKLIEKPVQLSKDLDLSDILPGRAAMWHQQYPSGIFEFYVSIPVELAGKVMGKGGAHIKRLQQISDTVISMNKADSDAEKELIIRGKTEESVLGGVDVLEHFLQTGQFLDESQDAEDDTTFSASKPSSSVSHESIQHRQNVAQPKQEVSPARHESSLQYESSRTPPESIQVRSQGRQHSPSLPTAPKTPTTPLTSISIDDVFPETTVGSINVWGELLSLHCSNRAILKEALNVLEAHFSEDAPGRKSPPKEAKRGEVRRLISYEDCDFTDGLKESEGVIVGHECRRSKSLPDSKLPAQSSLTDDCWDDVVDGEDIEQGLMHELQKSMGSERTSTPARGSGQRQDRLEISAIPPPSQTADSGFLNLAHGSQSLEASSVDRNFNACRSKFAESSEHLKNGGSKSKGFGAGSRMGLFGYIQPTNIRREPLCPLSNVLEIQQVEDEEDGAGECSATARRRNFAHRESLLKQMGGSGSHSGERLVYPPHFLLACSKSPIAQSPPAEWHTSGPDLPEICLPKMLDESLPTLRSIRPVGEAPMDILQLDDSSSYARQSSISLEWDGGATAL